MITLSLDTSDNKKTILVLDNNGDIIEKVLQVEKPKADSALELIEEAVNTAGITLKDIHHIYVKKGPGSYTGLRVGISIINALSFVLNIPVNDQEIGKIEEPQYE